MIFIPRAFSQIELDDKVILFALFKAILFYVKIYTSF